MAVINQIEVEPCDRCGHGQLLITAYDPGDATSPPSYLARCRCLEMPGVPYCDACWHGYHCKCCDRPEEECRCACHCECDWEM